MSVREVFDRKRGYYLEYKEDGVYLVVEKAGLKAGDVTNYIKRKQINSFVADKVKIATIAANGQPEKIAEAQAEQKLLPDITLRVAADRMAAAIKIYSVSIEEGITKEDILKVIEEAGISYGIKERIIQKIVKTGYFDKEVVVAEGLKPIPGKNGEVKFHFDIEKEAMPKLLDDGSVDFHNLDLIDNVSKGELLVSLIPPTESVPGCSVFNMPVSLPDGRPATLPRGDNVTKNDEETELYAGIDGQVSYVNKKVVVNPVYQVPGDVGPSTGNIEFVGNVIVNGNVITGFQVRAVGNVEVKGAVEGAAIYAGGNIVLYRGMQGMGRGIIDAAGNITAKFIENSIVNAGGNIKTDALMHSNVSCSGDIEIINKKGLLVGGVTRANNLITAKVVGSRMETVTEIEIGVVPMKRERLNDLEEQRDNLSGELSKAKQLLAKFEKMDELGLLDESRRQIRNKALNLEASLIGQLEEIEEEIEEIESEIENNTKAKLKVSDIIHSGTKITIGKYNMTLKKEANHCSFYVEDANIKMGMY